MIFARPTLSKHCTCGDCWAYLQENLKTIINHDISSFLVLYDELGDSHPTNNRKDLPKELTKTRGEGHHLSHLCSLALGLWDLRSNCWHSPQSLRHRPRWPGGNSILCALKDSTIWPNQIESVRGSTSPNKLVLEGCQVYRVIG